MECTYWVDSQLEVNQHHFKVKAHIWSTVKKQIATTLLITLLVNGWCYIICISNLYIKIYVSNPKDNRFNIFVWLDSISASHHMRVVHLIYNESFLSHLQMQYNACAITKSAHSTYMHKTIEYVLYLVSLVAVSLHAIFLVNHADHVTPDAAHILVQLVDDGGRNQAVHDHAGEQVGGRFAGQRVRMVTDHFGFLARGHCKPNEKFHRSSCHIVQKEIFPWLSLMKKWSIELRTVLRRFCPHVNPGWILVSENRTSLHLNNIFGDYNTKKVDVMKRSIPKWIIDADRNEMKTRQTYRGKVMMIFM